MRRNLSRAMAGLAVSAGMLVAVAGCGGAAPAATTRAASGGAPSATPTRLVIYQAEGYAQAVANAFQKKTGIHVEVTHLSTGPLIAKIEAEKDNPRWDVAWFDGDGPMYSLDQQGLLLRNWQPAGTKNYTRLGRSLVAPDRSYIPTGVTAAAAIAYNTKLVPPSQAPTHWSDLLKPEFRNAVGMDNPAISGPTYPVVAGFLYRMGIAPGERFFERLKEDGLHIYPTNKPTLAAVNGGVLKVGLAQDAAEIQAIHSGAPFRLVYPAGGVTMLAGVLGIDSHAPDMAAAKEFAQFVLTPQAQHIMLTKGGGDSNFNPIVRGQRPNPNRVQTGIRWNLVPVAWQADHYNSIQTWFKDSITQ